MPDQVDWRALEREASPGRAVGRLLRDQREARGLDLDEVAKSLRIRRTQLEAIEEGRFERLPGAAYVPAFLRAYAAHVGLDPEKVLTAYHLSGPVPIKRPVTLPADFPIVERRAPIGLAVLTVLLVVAAGYAAWHYLPREQAVVAEKVPPVPDRLLAARPADPQPATAGASPAPSQLPSQAAAPVAAPMAPDTWPPRPAVTAAPPPASAVPAQAPAPSAAPAQAPTQAQATPPAAPPPAPLAPPVVSAVPPPPPPPMPTFGQAQAAQPQPQAASPSPATPPQQAEAPRPAGSVPNVEEASRPPAAEAAPSLPVRADTRVTVRVNSWIELRAPNGDVLAQSYVRAGESYVVPAGIAYRITDAR